MAEETQNPAAQQAIEPKKNPRLYPESLSVPASLIPNGPAGTLFKPEDIVTITWDNLELLKPEWLKDDNVFIQLKLFVSDILDSRDPVDASTAFEKLYELLGQQPNLPTEDPDLFWEYIHLLIALKACFLITMPAPDVARFFEENLITLLEIQDFPIQERLEELFELYRKSTDGLKDLSTLILRSVEKNQELLGTINLTMRGHERNERQTASNWIVDYNQFTAGMAQPGVPLSKRGAVERATYITKSVNVRTLSNDEKNVLTRLLEFYDWLKFTVVKEAVQVEAQPRLLEKKRLVPPPAPSPKPPARTITAPPTPKIFGRRVDTVKPQASPPAPLPQGEVEGYPGSPKADWGNREGGHRPGEDTEELYRKTLEELRRMRAQDLRPGGPEEPPAINEAIIQAGPKGQLLGGKGGEMGAGKGEQTLGTKLQELKDKFKGHDIPPKSPNPKAQ